jgi:phage shock protein A
MGLRRRLGMLLRSRARRLQGPEDPLAVLELAYGRELGIADEVRQGLAGVAAARARLRIERQRLERRLAAADAAEAEPLGRQVAILIDQEERLGDDHRALEAAARRHQARLALLRTEREALSAQHTADRGRLRAATALAGLGPEDTAVRVLLERARDRIVEVRARADALAELGERRPGLEPELRLPPGPPGPVAE